MSSSDSGLCRRRTCSDRGMAVREMDSMCKQELKMEELANKKQYTELLVGTSCVNLSQRVVESVKYEGWGDYSESDGQPAGILHHDRHSGCRGAGHGV